MCVFHSLLYFLFIFLVGVSYFKVLLCFIFYSFLFLFFYVSPHSVTLLTKTFKYEVSLGCFTCSFFARSTK